MPLPAMFVLVAALLASTAAPSIARGVQPAELEQEVKAAYLYNFLKFAEWPAHRSVAGAGEITVGVLADREFADVAEKALAGKTAQGLPVRVIRFSSVEELAKAPQRVHLLYLGRDTDPGAALAALGGRPILTVGDGDGFCTRGGIIALVRDGERLRFDINSEAARRSGVRLSSKLLSLARTICSDKGP